MNMETAGQFLAWVLSNFDLAMFGLGLVFILLHRLMKKNLAGAEIVYRWVAAFALGFTGIYAFVMHAFYGDMTATAIGWQNSPFQLEVAVADLALGILGVLSFNASYAFRLATVIGNTIWLWGDAIGHLYQRIQFNHDTISNVGSWFWMDLLIPLLLILCIIKLRSDSKVIKR